MLTRRTLMAATPLAASAAASPAAAQPPAPSAAASGQAPGFYRYRLGDMEITAINDGYATRPLEGFIRNAELADVKRAMAESFLSESALQITFTTLVVRSGGRTILLDTGNGDSGAPTSGTWMKNFRAAGFDPDAVDTVVISHFHGDHINGLRRKDGSAVFPKAEIVVPEAEWAFWMDDARAAGAPDGLKPVFAGARRVFGPIAKDVRRIADGREAVAGVRALAAYGHTPGHTVYRLSSGSAAMVFVADITNHPALFVRHPEWSAVFDVEAERARETRIRMLDMAAADRVQVAFYHAPFPATGHVAKRQDGYHFVPVQWSQQV